MDEVIDESAGVIAAKNPRNSRRRGKETDDSYFANGQFVGCNSGKVPPDVLVRRKKLSHHRYPRHTAKYARHSTNRGATAAARNRFVWASRVRVVPRICITYLSYPVHADGKSKGLPGDSLEVVRADGEIRMNPNSSSAPC